MLPSQARKVLARCRQRVSILYALGASLQTEGDGLLCRGDYSLA